MPEIVQPGTGLQGPRGIQGNTGLTGNTGPAGAAGPAGGAVASATEVEITVTTGQTVLTYTPTVSGPFQIGAYLRVITAATTVAVTATYTDATGAQTATLLASGSLAVGSYPIDPLVIDAIAGDAISIVVTAATIDQVYASAAIWGTASGGSGPTIASYDTTVLTKLSLAPVAYWKLDDPVGSGTAADSSGNGYTLTVNGTVTFGEASVVPTDSETSARGDGSTGFLSTATLPAKIPTGASPFTVIAAINSPAPVSTGTLGVVNWGGNGYGPLLGLYAGNTAFWSNPGVAQASASAPSASVPHLIGGIWDGGATIAVLDGWPSPWGGATAPVQGTPPGMSLFAFLQTTDFCNFPIGRVAIFAGVLTPKDWALLMQAFTGVG